MAYMKRWAAAGAAVVVVLLLAGCYGPPPVQYAALESVGGHPTAVVAACGKTSVTVRVYRYDATGPGLADLELWSNTVPVPAGAGYVEVPLLAGPGDAGPPRVVGQSESAFRVVPLTSFAAGHRYVLDSSEPGPEGSSAPQATFTLDDVATLAPGQVLTDHGRQARDDFVTQRCR
jgi:hypothetical protein